MKRSISEILAMTMPQADNILAALMPWAIERLELGMERYNHLCGIPTSSPASSHFERDKIQFSQMIKKDEAGHPVMSGDDCVVFLSSVTDLTAEKCLAFQMRNFASRDA